jgi:hypothetical protein
MPISKIPVGAIQSGTIGTSQIADDAVTTAKILNDNVTSAKIPNDAVGSTEISSNAVTRDELQSAAVNNISSDSIILNSTNGTADAGDFLVLDGTDVSSTNANHRILFDETFVDKVGLFNINTLGSAGDALKVNEAGNAFEFGTAGGLTLLNKTTLSSSSDVQFQGLMTGYDSYKCVYNIQRSTDLIIRVYFMSGASILSSGYHSTGASAHGSGISSYGDDSQGFMNNTATWSSQESATTTPVNGYFYIVNPNDANDYTTIIGSQSLWSGSTNLVANTIAASSTTAQAQDGLRFYPSTGNFANGFIKLYGIS